MELHTEGFSDDLAMIMTPCVIDFTRTLIQSEIGVTKMN